MPGCTILLARAYFKCDISCTSADVHVAMQVTHYKFGIEKLNVSGALYMSTETIQTV